MIAGVDKEGPPLPDRAIVVFDEAYYEFAQGPDFPDTLQYMRQGRKVVVPTSSMLFPVASARIAMALTLPSLPWSVAMPVVV